MRSWSKWVIFSRRMKSSRSDGPRAPAFSEFWSSLMRRPWSVVRSCPSGSSRNRSRASCLAEPGRAGLDGLRAGRFLLGMELLPLHLRHLGARLLEARIVPGAAEPGKDLLLLLPDVLLEALADRLDLGEPPRRLRVEAVDLLEQRLDPLHLFPVLAAPRGERGVALRLSLGERPVDAGVLDLLVGPQLRRQLAPEIAPGLGRRLQNLPERPLGLPVL